jgi:hypothetical protein
VHRNRVSTKYTTQLDDNVWCPSVGASSGLKLEKESMGSSYKVAACGKDITFSQKVQYGSYPYKALLCQGTGKIRGFP